MFNDINFAFLSDMSNFNSCVGNMVTLCAHSGGGRSRQWRGGRVPHTQVHQAASTDDCGGQGSQEEPSSVHLQVLRKGARRQQQISWIARGRDFSWALGLNLTTLHMQETVK